MEVFPGEYRKIDMTKSEKLFVKYSERSKKEFGYCIIHINPALQQGESIDAVIVEGISLLPFTVPSITIVYSLVESAFAIM